MPAFEALGGMPYWMELLSSSPARSAHFYSALCGWTFEGNEYRLARKEGLPVAGIVTQPEDAPFPDTWVTYFLADNLDEDVRRAEDLGARVLSPITDVRLGRMALLADPSGALLGLIEPPGEDAFIAAGEPGTPVWHELSATTGYERVTHFYEQLFDWDTTTVDAGRGSALRYTTALMDGAPFCGIRDAEGHFPPQVPSFWQGFLGIADADDATGLISENHGEVIRGPEDSEFGRLLVAADLTGAIITLCEVDTPAPEDISEADSVLEL